MPTVNYLKYIRVSKNLSIAKLSQHTGISKTVLKYFESGRARKRGIPYRRALILSQYFEVEVYGFLGFDPMIEISQEEYLILFPPRLPAPSESPLINLFITQRRSLKDTIAYLNRNKNNQ